MRSPFIVVALRYAGEANALRSRLHRAELDRDAALALAAERLQDVVLLERQVALLLTTTPSDLREMGA